MLSPNIRNLPKRFQRKGQERLTIMLVPHGGQQILSLQLNWITIAVLFALLSGVVFLAALSFYERYRYAHEKEKLIQLYGNKLKNAIKLESLSKENSENYQNLLEKLESMAFALDIPERELELLEIPKKSQKQIRETQGNISLRNEVLPPIYILRSLYSYAKSHLPLLKKLYNWHSYAFAVYQDMPLGRPFKSFQALRDTSGFGKRINPVSRSGTEFHNGYDTAGPLSTPVHATAAGTVHKSYYDPNGYGRTVILKHNFGLYSAYAHLAASNARTGAKIKKGQKIGTMGNSGRTTGVHLHYEIHRGFGNRINPQPFICVADFHTNSCFHYHSRQND